MPSKIETVFVAPSSLSFADYNPRAMDEREFEDLKSSLREEGFLVPVVANKTTGRIVGGHQRVRAAIELGLEEVPVIWVERDEDGERLLNVRLNHIEGRDDPMLLAALIRQMGEEERKKTGLAEEEIMRLLNEEESRGAREINESDFGDVVPTVCPKCGYVIK